MILVNGILVCEKEDREGKTVAITGATVKDNAPIVSANGNILGRILESQAVFRVLTDESAKLASLAGLVTGCPSEGDGNVLTGTTYLETVPFIKIRASLMENSYLRAAILAGNLFFNSEVEVIQQRGMSVIRSIIEKITIRVSGNIYSKIHLDA